MNKTEWAVFTDTNSNPKELKRGFASKEAAEAYKESVRGFAGKCAYVQLVYSS